MALFPTNYTLTQGSLHYRLATLGYQKRNTYGVEIFFLYHDCRFFTPKFMLDCVKKLQRLQHWKNHIKSLFMACFIGISMITCHKQATYMLHSFIKCTENHSF